MSTLTAFCHAIILSECIAMMREKCEEFSSRIGYRSWEGGSVGKEKDSSSVLRTHVKIAKQSGMHV